MRKERSDCRPAGGLDPPITGAVRGTTIVLAFSLALAGADAAWACRGPFHSLAENFASAKAVFRGKVIEVRERGAMPSMPQSKLLEIELSVEHVYKGSLGKTVKVQGDTTTCGFGGFLERGEVVVIFAGGEPLGTSAVSGNFVLRGAPTENKPLAELEALAAGKK
ncbi:MAG: hypothetical protein U1E65_19285 [Myxococcota bacterium]